MLLAIQSTCSCRWQGFGVDMEDALQLWAEHAERDGHEDYEHTESE